MNGLQIPAPGPPAVLSTGDGRAGERERGFKAGIVAISLQFGESQPKTAFQLCDGGVFFLGGAIQVFQAILKDLGHVGSRVETHKTPDGIVSWVNAEVSDAGID
jgi:hypothetical protein